MKNGHTTRQKAPAGRYALLDELRGLDLVSMMLYHACWDMMFLFGIWMDWYAGERVIFGVLTFLGTAMLLTGVLEPLLKKVMPAVGLAVSAVLFAVCYPVGLGWVGLGGWKLMLPQSLYANYFTAFFGFYPDWFYSADYFGLLPWLFLFWAGYYLHKAVGRRRMEPLRRPVCPALGWMGRHSLLLYLLHQPVIYGVLSAAAVLFA